MYQRLELDWMFYNMSMEYAELVTEGDVKKYLRGIN